jgi:ankyrin repeat protein
LFRNKQRRIKITRQDIEATTTTTTTTTDTSMTMATTTTTMTYQDKKALREEYFTSATHWKLEKLKSCIDRGIPIGIQDVHGGNALHCVINGCFTDDDDDDEDENRRIDCVKYLIHECNIDINLCNYDGQSPLHLAIGDHAYYNIIEYLIYNCPTINVHMTNNRGQNALHLLLLSEEDTYFDIAHEDGYVDMIKYLISEHKINVYANDNDGRTTLQYACGHGHIDIVKYLIEECHIDNINRQDNDGYNALLNAICRNQYEVVKYLINDGRIDIHTLEYQGYNALHLSIGMRDKLIGLKIVQCLLDDGHADLTSTSSNGENVFDLVCNETDVGPELAIDIDMVVFLVTRLLAK